MRVSVLSRRGKPHKGAGGGKKSGTLFPFEGKNFLWSHLIVILRLERDGPGGVLALEGKFNGLRTRDEVASDAEQGTKRLPSVEITTDKCRGETRAINVADWLVAHRSHERSGLLGWPVRV